MAPDILVFCTIVCVECNLSMLLLCKNVVDETTTDIICIRCKKDDSDKPNEIVLCDTCGIGKRVCILLCGCSILIMN